MSAVQDAVDLLNGSKLLDGEAYPLIATDNPVDVSNTTAVVSDVGDQYQDYGSNLSSIKQSTVAINIYYGSKSEIIADDIEPKIISLFQKKGWRLIYSPGRIITPRTNQITKVFQFSKVSEITWN